MLESMEEEAEKDREKRKESLCMQATALKCIAKDATRSPEDVISTPLPGETLAMFYARSRTSPSLSPSP